MLKDSLLVHRISGAIFVTTSKRQHIFWPFFTRTPAVLLVARGGWYGDNSRKEKREKDTDDSRRERITTEGARLHLWKEWLPNLEIGCVLRHVFGWVTSIVMDNNTGPHMAVVSISKRSKIGNSIYSSDAARDCQQGSSSRSGRDPRADTCSNLTPDWYQPLNDVCFIEPWWKCFVSATGKVTLER